MKRITVFRHPECVRCARIARLHHWFDFLDRIEPSTAIPPTGPLVPGQIVVLEHATGISHRGAAAVEVICRQNPLYAPFRWLLRFARIRQAIERSLQGERVDAGPTRLTESAHG